MQNRSEQEAQIQLLIDSAVALESQGQSVSLEVMSGLAGVNTQDIERYRSPLSTLPSGLAMLFAGVCSLIARQFEVGSEDSAETIAVAPVPVAGSIFTHRPSSRAVPLRRSDRALRPFGRVRCSLSEQP